MSAQVSQPGLVPETARLLSLARSRGVTTLLVSAAVLRDTQARVLIATRPEGKAMAGMWEFPGGKVELDETPLRGLHRELAEELGIQIDVDDAHYFGTVTHDYPDFTLIMPTYECRSWAGNPAGLEGQQLAWVEPQELSQYQMPPADAPLVDLLRGGR